MDSSTENLLCALEGTLLKGAPLYAHHAGRSYRVGGVWGGGIFLEVKQHWPSGRKRIVRFEYGPKGGGAGWYGSVMKRNARKWTKRDYFEPTDAQLRYYARLVKTLSWSRRIPTGWKL